LLLSHATSQLAIDASQDSDRVTNGVFPPGKADYNLFLKAAHTVNLEDGRDPDARRTQFFREHLAELARAISDGAKVARLPRVEPAR
jgi:hypothetical protein